MDQVKARAEFWKRAVEFVEKNLKGQDLPTIKPGTEEWRSWRQYFACHLGLDPLPFAMRAVLDDRMECMTVPTAFPVLFDTSFREDPNWKDPEPTREAMPRHLRESYEELLERYGPNFGLHITGDRHRDERRDELVRKREAALASRDTST